MFQLASLKLAWSPTAGQRLRTTTWVNSWKLYERELRDRSTNQPTHEIKQEGSLSWPAAIFFQYCSPTCLGGQIWPRILNLWPQLPSYPCACYPFNPVFRSPRQLRPPNSLGGRIWPRIWNQWPQLPLYPCACYSFNPIVYISKAIAASKQPRRSNLTSDLKSVTQRTHVTEVSGYVC